MTSHVNMRARVTDEGGTVRLLGGDEGCTVRLLGGDEGDDGVDDLAASWTRDQIHVRGLDLVLEQQIQLLPQFPHQLCHLKGWTVF